MHKSLWYSKSMTLQLHWLRWLGSACACACVGILTVLPDSLGAATNTPASLHLHLRSRTTASEGEKPTIRVAATDWDPRETAIFICDMWDDHWCRSAAKRVTEMAKPLNSVVSELRKRGVLIVHSPSSVVKAYQDTPQRRYAMTAPMANPPVPLSTAERWGTAWCWPDPAKESGLPIDDSDMGCSCPQKCTIREAWTRQHPHIQIARGDAITDNGQEAYNLLVQHRIRNVILVGVHLNMCVLGRPFGIRQMVKEGFNVALMRDLTDTMYDPRKYPYVDHFSGTDLVVHHVEQFWCPSFESSDITGKPPFRFEADQRDIFFR